MRGEEYAATAVGSTGPYLDRSPSSSGKLVDTPPTLFKQLDILFNRLNILQENIFHFHDRLVGAAPEPANGKEANNAYGAISHYEQEIEKALMEIARMEDRLNQIQRRL